VPIFLRKKLSLMMMLKIIFQNNNYRQSVEKKLSSNRLEAFFVLVPAFLQRKNDYF
jgi:hypothetical protein